MVADVDGGPCLFCAACGAWCTTQPRNLKVPCGGRNGRARRPRAASTSPSPTRISAAATSRRLPATCRRPSPSSRATKGSRSSSWKIERSSSTHPPELRRPGASSRACAVHGRLRSAQVNPAALSLRLTAVRCSRLPAVFLTALLVSCSSGAAAVVMRSSIVLFFFTYSVNVFDFFYLCAQDIFAQR